MSEVPQYSRYWGKAEKDGDRYHLLPHHCLDVAAVGSMVLANKATLRQRFAQIAGLDETLCSRWIVLFLALHDIGKFSESFQNLRPDLLVKLQSKASTKSYVVRHDSLGNLLWRDWLWETVESRDMPGFSDILDNPDEWQDIFGTIIQAYTGHHGTPPTMNGPNNIRMSLDRHFGKDDCLAAEFFLDEVCKLMLQSHPFRSLSLDFELEERVKKVSWLMAGFVVLCDWIGSNSLWFPLCKEYIPLDEYWVTRAIPQAERAIRKAGIDIFQPLSELHSISELFSYIAVPTPLQKFVSECPIDDAPQLFILEDVTGSGKTEAALLLAGRLMAAGRGNGLFVALPTMATSNAMYDRMAKVYRRLFADGAFPSLVLAHGARHLSRTFMESVAEPDECGMGETATAQCAAWLADNRKKALLADVGVGTLDQALLAVLPARFQSLRLFGLAEHILIVDEVHSYDPYMNKLLQNLLAFHAAMGGSAILLSATLPTHVRREFIAAYDRGLGEKLEHKLHDNLYPLATAYSNQSLVVEEPVEAMPQRRCSVLIKLIAEPEEILRVIVEATQRGECVCWIRNTVHDALAGFTALKESVPPDELMLFHARFAMGDRLDIESSVLSAFGRQSRECERRGKVLVSTQVVEQSLDLDFDLLISDLAPMDLLIQRAGRLHRHPRDERGNPLPQGFDQRKAPRMIIHGPMPDDDATGDWFKAAFPKASFVYPSHGCLWLTARLLKDKTMRMPEDARELIEAAFSESADNIPEPLQQRDQNAEAQWQADKSLAHINMLKLEEGYTITVNQWRDDMRTPTRLGGMDNTVRLARWDGTVLSPWYTEGDFPWDMSQVSIRSGLVSAEVEHNDPALADAVAQLKDRLPDKGKWSILVPLLHSRDGRWRGMALNKKGGTVVLEYDPLIGVTVGKKEG